MSQALLGDTIDIHGGGLDLQFPHHENELAQSESATGQEFARVWMHNGLLKLGNRKMAGSDGNVWNIADALKVVSGDILRFFILNTHYRSPIDMGDWDPKLQPIPPNVENAAKALESFDRYFERYERITGHGFHTLPISSQADVDPDYREYSERFHAAMDDDFNTGAAIGVMFELLNALNRRADAAEKDPTPESPISLRKATQLLRKISGLLGLFWEAPKSTTLGGGDELVSGLMQLLLDLRANLRSEAKAAAKDNPLKKALFDQTDVIRKRLADLNVTLEDRPGGTTWRVG